MARVWIEDRAGHTAYQHAVAKAKKVGRTPPGRWRVRWYGPDGKPKMETFTRRVDADTERSRLEARLGDGTYRDPAAARAKFGEIAEAWLAAQAHLKRSTRNRYRGMLDLHVLPRWGTTPLDRIRYPAVRAAGLGHLHLTPHKLRHTAASLAIASGADVNVIQTMLGHKSATLTLDVYEHLFPDRLDEVSDKMDERRAMLLAKAQVL